MDKKRPHGLDETEYRAPRGIWYDDETCALQLLLDRQDVGLSDKIVTVLGRVFEPKEEVHITIIGRSLGQQLMEVARRDFSAQADLRQAISETEWAYEIQDRMYHLFKDKHVKDSQGNISTLHAESIIVMVGVAGIQRFYRELGRMAGIEIEVPPTHVTLYTRGDPSGIGVYNQADFEKYASTEISPTELIRVCPANLDEILRFLPEVQAGHGLWQNRFHEFDVYDHTLAFVRYVKDLTDDTDIVAAGYLHDVGKPVVAKPKEGGGALDVEEPGKLFHTFAGHEKAGEEMVSNMDPRLFRELGLDQDRIAALVGYHYLPMQGIDAMRDATNYAQFLEEYQKLQRTLEGLSVSKEDVLTMFLADKLAQGKGCEDREELFAVREALLGRVKMPREIYEIQKALYKNKE